MKTAQRCSPTWCEQVTDAVPVAAAVPQIVEGVLGLADAPPTDSIPWRMFSSLQHFGEGSLSRGPPRRDVVLRLPIRQRLLRSETAILLVQTSQAAYYPAAGNRLHCRERQE
jgi:hypothetical protein